jgi:hypothetical protein
MNHLISAVTIPKARTLADRVRDVASSLGCDAIWVRASGPHVLLGLSADEPFARVTPLGSGAFGLSFRRVDPSVLSRAHEWEPLLLVDSLSDIVEHALIGAAAPLRPLDGSGS